MCRSRRSLVCVARYAHGDYGEFAKNELSRRRGKGIYSTFALCKEAEEPDDYGQYTDVDESLLGPPESSGAAPPSSSATSSLKDDDELSELSMDDDRLASKPGLTLERLRWLMAGFWEMWPLRMIYHLYLTVVV